MRIFGIAVSAAALVFGGMMLPVSAQQILSFAIPSPPQAHLVKEVLGPWAKKVTAESEGSVKIVVKAGRILATPGNVYDRVRADIAQIGWGVQERMGGKFRLSQVATLPFEANTAEEASVALWRLYAKGVTTAEYDEVKPLAIIAFPPTTIHTSKRRIMSLEDLKGMRIGTVANLSGELVKMIGGVPISLPAPAMYPGGPPVTVSGVMIVWNAFLRTKLYEAARHHFEGPFGTGTAMVFISNKAYANLPRKGRMALDANSGEGFSHSYGRFWDRVGNIARNIVSQMPGRTFTQMSAAGIAKWRVKVQPFVTDWADRTPNGAAALDAYRKEIAAFRKGM